MRALALALLLASCPRPQPPAPIDPGAFPAPACAPGGVRATSADVCRDMFTESGWPCALCGQEGCTDPRPDVLVYCARGCGDPLCRVRGHF